MNGSWFKNLVKHKNIRTVIIIKIVFFFVTKCSSEHRNKQWFYNYFLFNVNIFVI